VELLNNDVKANAAGRRRPRTVVELTGELRAYARRRQRQPGVVARFFQHPDTRSPCQPGSGGRKMPRRSGRRLTDGDAAVTLEQATASATTATPVEV
jgi:hypothetical protein